MLQLFELIFEVVKSDCFVVEISCYFLVLGHQFSQLCLHFSSHLIHLHFFDGLELGFLAFELGIELAADTT